MWLEGHGLCFDGGVSDLQLLKGLARNGWGLHSCRISS